MLPCFFKLLAAFSIAISVALCTEDILSVFFFVFQLLKSDHPLQVRLSPLKTYTYAIAIMNSGVVVTKSTGSFAQAIIIL